MFAESVLGWFRRYGNSTGTFFDTVFPTLPLISVTLISTLLKMSNTAAYDWSSSTDLHLWFKCQESSPILKCTVVIRLSDSLVWSQEWAVVWIYPRYGPPNPTPNPLLLPWWRRRVGTGNPGPIAELFSSNQDIVYQSLETAPSVAWRQCAISYCILKTDCLLCV